MAPCDDVENSCGVLQSGGITMARDEDDFLASITGAGAKHTVGESLDSLSIEKLERRLALLRAEIERIEREKVRKHASRAAAATFFKSKPGT